MRRQLEEVAPRFVAMAHGIGMCVTATADDRGHPHTRVMQPVWLWDGSLLTGWVSTHLENPKVDHLQARPSMSLTYWHPNQDSCTADCDVEFVTGEAERSAAWDRFKATPEPAGFDPAIHPEWDSPLSPTFGVLALHPRWLRVMPGSLMTRGDGDVWTWRQA
jgi:general stress protein 26